MGLDYPGGGPTDVVVELGVVHDDGVGDVEGAENLQEELPDELVLGYAGALQDDSGGEVGVLVLASFELKLLYF